MFVILVVLVVLVVPVVVAIIVVVAATNGIQREETNAECHILWQFLVCFEW
jgi:ABC-type lipoprotein release transport system permease subunit